MKMLKKQKVKSFELSYYAHIFTFYIFLQHTLKFTIFSLCVFKFRVTFQ